MRRFPTFMAAQEAGGDAPGGFAGGPTQGTLPSLAMDGQEETNWCWSAVTQAVLAFRLSRQVSQQDIATEHAVRSGKAYTCAPPHRKKTAGGQCADTACLGSCNDAHILRVVLAEHGCFHSTVSNESAPSFTQIRAEVNAGRPLPCRVQWNIGGGHFIIVAGWSVGADGIERVHVLDPASNEGGEAIIERRIPYSTFVGDYELSGLTGHINYSYRVQ